MKYNDLISDVTYHEEVDEVTGLSRKIVVDSPDEKKQPLMEIRDKHNKGARKAYVVIGTSFAIAQMNAMSSRARRRDRHVRMLPRAVSRRKRLHNRTCAFQPTS